MSEPLDLDALKHKYEPTQGAAIPEWWAEILALIAELEATRAERDALRKAEKAWLVEFETRPGGHVCDDWRVRAERAEATVETLEAQCRSYHSALELAEAAIARVEALIGSDDLIFSTKWGQAVEVGRVRAALRGDHG